MESQRLIMNMKEMKCIIYFKLKSILDLSEEKKIKEIINLNNKLKCFLNLI